LNTRWSKFGKFTRHKRYTSFHSEHTKHLAFALSIFYPKYEIAFFFLRACMQLLHCIESAKFGVTFFKRLFAPQTTVNTYSNSRAADAECNKETKKEKDWKNSSQWKCYISATSVELWKWSEKVLMLQKLPLIFFFLNHWDNKPISSIVLGLIWLSAKQKLDLCCFCVSVKVHFALSYLSW
jgi:hypothetical protein